MNPMLNTIKKWWKYLTAKADSEFEKNADPKIQLEQAIRESKEQHQRLKEQAANVIAHQKQTEMRLDKAMVEMEKLTSCLLYTSPSPRDATLSRMPSSA